MINRELIRIKIVQLTYAYYQNGNKSIDTAEKELFFSLSKAYDLYNYLLLLIVAVTREERHRVEIATQRAQREGLEIPSQKFAYNKFAVQLEENKMLNDFMEAHKISWNDDIEFIRKMCNLIEGCSIYADYMASEDDSYEADREVWRKLYKQLIQNNADQYQRYMSEASRNWDFGRLAYMDVVIMQIAIAEMLTFPNIPISVTINEYVDLAKLYSTPKSGGYINGMLDSIAHFLVDNGMVFKALKVHEVKEKENN